MQTNGNIYSYSISSEIYQQLIQHTVGDRPYMIEGDRPYMKDLTWTQWFLRLTLDQSDADGTGVNTCLSCSSAY